LRMVWHWARYDCRCGRTLFASGSLIWPSRTKLSNPSAIR
jgi:hypothetical protein